MTLRNSLFLAALIAVPVAFGVWKFGLDSSEVRGSEHGIVRTAEPSAPAEAEAAGETLVAATEAPENEAAVETVSEPVPVAEPAPDLTPAQAVIANWKRPRGVTPQSFSQGSAPSAPDGEKLLMKAEEGGLDLDSLTEAEQQAYERAVRKRDQRARGTDVKRRDR